MFSRKLCNDMYFKFKPLTTKHLLTINRSSSSRHPDTIFLEKCLENPVIVIPESTKVDLIGPPNSKSNLRPIIRQKQLHESYLQKTLRQFQDETQDWNEKFWNHHNIKFVTERESYIKSQTNDDKKTLTSEEMSEFYKKFLDNNWKEHVTYNFEWYRRNFLILYYGIRVNLESVLKF
ncbi:hypothetical protein FQR65_LT07965 [Abscondita terminalis]|nr:hypothetical protein FQR65_LT07965 [Abscondita terminalis]